MKLKTILAASAFALAAPVMASAASFENCSGFSLATDANGTVDVLGSGFAECAFSITGADGPGGTLVTTFTAVADADYLVEFDWDYSTQDIDGSSFDPFGYVVDGMFMQLTLDGDPAPAFQNGADSFVVKNGQEFGWYITATDGILGAANADVFSDFTVIPLPAAGWMLLAGLGGLAAVRRKKS